MKNHWFINYKHPTGYNQHIYNGESVKFRWPVVNLHLFLSVYALVINASRLISDSDLNNKVYFCHKSCNGITYILRVKTEFKIFFYVPPVRKLVFSLQLRVAQYCVLRYRGMKCKNSTAHAPIAIQRSTIFFLFFFFFVQR